MTLWILELSGRNGSSKGKKKKNYVTASCPVHICLCLAGSLVDLDFPILIAVEGPESTRDQRIEVRDEKKDELE